MTKPAQDLVLSLASQILGIDDLDLDQDLFDVGADSLDLIELVTKLEDEHGWTINVRDVMRNPTIRALATYHEDTSN